MVGNRRLGRLGMLAVGLGVGAAVASTPGIASADPFSFDPNDIAISFDGTSLLKEGTAVADSGNAGEFNFAFADGANSSAYATDGTGNVAEADGTGAYVLAGSGNSDTAIGIGNSTDAEAGTDFFGGSGSNDFAYALGDNSSAFADGDNVEDTVGNNDIAAVIDPFGTVGSDAFSGGSSSANGDFDLAAAFGDDLNADHADGGNYLVDILPTVAGLDSALSTLLADFGSLF
jgi:hypothetical protein